MDNGMQMDDLLVEQRNRRNDWLACFDSYIDQGFELVLSGSKTQAQLTGIAEAMADARQDVISLRFPDAWQDDPEVAEAEVGDECLEEIGVPK